MPKWAMAAAERSIRHGDADHIGIGAGGGCCLRRDLAVGGQARRRTVGAGRIGPDPSAPRLAVRVALMPYGAVWVPAVINRVVGRLPVAPLSSAMVSGMGTLQVT